MLISRAVKTPARAAARESRSQIPELLSVYPPPRTPNFPATADSARMAAVADPPLRLRSRPQPHRIAAGLDDASHVANRSKPPAGTDAVRAARSIVHGFARRRSSSAPVACAARKAW